MSMQGWDSIRAQQQSYEKEIRSTYSQHLNLFVNHSSDLLHLKLLPSSFKGQPYLALTASAQFNKYDTILEVRGSVITKVKLLGLLADKVVKAEELPVLLRLNQEKGWLLSPKNASKWLFWHPINKDLERQLWVERGNCYVQNHYGSKLMIVAGRDILKGEELILDRDNYQHLLYRAGEQ